MLNRRASTMLEKCERLDRFAESSAQIKPDADLATLSQFRREGRCYLFRVAASVHEVNVAPSGIVGLMRNWSGREKKLFLDVRDGKTAVYKRLQAAGQAYGMTVDEATQALMKGELDFFAALAPDPELAPIIDRLIEIGDQLHRDL